MRRKQKNAKDEEKILEQDTPTKNRVEYAKEINVLLQKNKTEIMNKIKFNQAQIEMDQTNFSALQKKTAEHNNSKTIGQLNSELHDLQAKLANLKKRKAEILKKVRYFEMRETAYKIAFSDVEKIIKLMPSIKNEAKKSKIREKEVNQSMIKSVAKKLRQKGYRIENVVTRARVPVIKMKDPETTVSIDLVFNNLLAVHNTRLIKTYVEFDPRSKILIYLVKNWANKKNINDATMGTFSSYCLVIMAIHFLQSVGILPNLQGKEARMLQFNEDFSEMKIDQKTLSHKNKENKPSKPFIRDGIDITFLDDICSAKTLPRGPYLQLNRPTGNLTIADIVYGFFKYYACDFDFLKHVVTIHLDREHLPRMKQNLWPKNKAWKISVEDPFLTADTKDSHDLANAVSSQGQKRIISAFQSTYLGLRSELKLE
mmetsp:Transcript_18156/g.26860  ORF Transcript_18156/g.26860 Transcript_18156/m.26860 type:complete len:427 (-) Transcript_18156:6-1286(-)